MDNIICYHHDDLDGIASAAVILKKYPSAKCIAVNYGDTWDPAIINNAQVFVVDFSFPDIQLLKNACRELYWIDHHRTAMEQQKTAWNDPSIPGKRTLELAGCELTWMYLYPDIPMPEIIKLIGDMDMWEFEYGYLTRTVCEAAKYELTDPTDDLWAVLFCKGIDEAALEDLSTHGAVLLEAKEQRIKKTFKNGTDIALFGYQARIMNATTDISETGSYVYEQDNYDIAVMWQMIGKDVILSFRSNKVDVGRIAERFDGGGHKAAAGATITFTELMNIYNGFCSDPETEVA
jgi:oligoribonuclease NrnB/cAMP/cGMP phosphodiesterase (DHH superfamily)